MDKATYEKQALALVGEVCECLRAEGLEPGWNGTMASTIGVSVEWRRRRRLE